MLYHETIESYYTNNFSALYFSENIKMQSNFTLSDFENMLPYEREIYMALMQNKLKELEKLRNK